MGGLLLIAGCMGEQAPPHEDEAAHERSHIAGMAAHHICAGVFVVGRDYERSADEVVAQDIRRFPLFKWQDDFEYGVNFETRTASVSGADFGTRSAEYNGDQGCTILPDGLEDVTYEPQIVERLGPDPATTAWPTGDVGAYHESPPPEVDMAALEAALDWTMAQGEHNTRALVVIYAGKILGERYAPGFTRNTPQISWSQGKSIASALVGAAIQAGHLDAGLDDPVPVPEWHGEDDPRREIRIRDILNMSSGLDFVNLRLTDSLSWTHANEHFRIYFEGIDVFEHAIDQPMDTLAGRGLPLPELRPAHGQPDRATGGRGARGGLAHVPPAHPVRPHRGRGTTSSRRTRGATSSSPATTTGAPGTGPGSASSTCGTACGRHPMGGRTASSRRAGWTS